MSGPSTGPSWSPRSADDLARPRRRRPHLVGRLRGPGLGLPARPGPGPGRDGAVGVRATELGPDGFLPDDPRAKAETLAAHGLRAVGGFVPSILHEPGHDPLPELDRQLDAFVAAEAGTLVLAAADRAGTATTTGRSWTPTAGPRCWPTSTAAQLGPRSAASAARLHPHVGTMVERADEVQRVLDGSGIGCAWTPATCSSAAPTRSTSSGEPPTGSRTPTSRTSTRPGPRRCGPVTRRTPRRWRAGCTGHWARAMSTSPRSCAG